MKFDKEIANIILIFQLIKSKKILTKFKKRRINIYIQNNGYLAK